MKNAKKEAQNAKRDILRRAITAPVDAAHLKNVLGGNNKMEVVFYEEIDGKYFRGEIEISPEQYEEDIANAKRNRTYIDFSLT